MLEKYDRDNLLLAQAEREVLQRQLPYGATVRALLLDATEVASRTSIEVLDARGHRVEALREGSQLGWPVRHRDARRQRTPGQGVGGVAERRKPLLPPHVAWPLFTQ